MYTTVASTQCLEIGKPVLRRRGYFIAFTHESRWEKCAALPSGTAFHARYVLGQAMMSRVRIDLRASDVDQIKKQRERLFLTSNPGSKNVMYVDQMKKQREQRCFLHPTQTRRTLRVP